MRHSISTVCPSDNVLDSPNSTLFAFWLPVERRGWPPQCLHSTLRLLTWWATTLFTLSACPLDNALYTLPCIPSDHPSKDLFGHHNVYIPPIRRMTRWVATLFTLCPSVDATFGHSHSVSPAELAWWTSTLSMFRSSLRRPIHSHSTFSLSGRTACATIMHSRCCRSRQRYHYILVDLCVVPSTVPAVGKPLQH